MENKTLLEKINYLLDDSFCSGALVALILGVTLGLFIFIDVFFNNLTESEMTRNGLEKRMVVHHTSHPAVMIWAYAGEERKPSVIVE